MSKVKYLQILVNVGALAFSFLFAAACRNEVLVPSPTASASGELPPTHTSVAHTATPSLTPTVEITPTQIVENTQTATPVSSWFQPVPLSTAIEGGYALVTQYPAVLYTSPEQAAVAGEQKKTLPGDEVYVSYGSTALVDGKVFYEVEEGGWMAGSVLTVLRLSEFSGIEVVEAPTNGFGWLIEPSFSYYGIDASGGPAPMAHHYPRFTLFTVLTVIEDDTGEQWFEIGPDEWVKDQEFSYVQIRASAPEPVNKSRWIEVNLGEQILVVYEENQPVFATLVSTGKERGWTGAGAYTIYNTAEQYSLISPDKALLGFYYLEDVPWILYYEGSWALHGAYWHDEFGRPNSHGCVNLSVPDAEWVYRWAEAGDWVFLTW